MTPKERIESVFAGNMPDKVPFMPYANLLPRGEFSREMRNRGMGLLGSARCIVADQPNVITETWVKDGASTTRYRTPVGSVEVSRVTEVGRIADGGSVQKRWMIQDPADFEPVMFMIQDTEYRLNNAAFINAERDMGDDGIIRSSGIVPPYISTMGYFSFEEWAFVQYDHPDLFFKLVEALEEQQQRLCSFVVESASTLLVCGDVRDRYGPERYESLALPTYTRYVPKLKAAGKICMIHAHNSNLQQYSELIARTGVQVIEAYTPPPISDFSLSEARRVWGNDMVIWVNFPEPVFLEGPEKAKAYALDLLEADSHPERLALGMTELGTYGIDSDAKELVFKNGVRAIMDAIDEFSRAGG